LQSFVALDCDIIRWRALNEQTRRPIRAVS
jgi:hypothetical protein